MDDDPIVSGIRGLFELLSPTAIPPNVAMGAPVTQHGSVQHDEPTNATVGLDTGVDKGVGLTKEAVTKGGALTFPAVGLQKAGENQRGDTDSDDDEEVTALREQKELERKRLMKRVRPGVFDTRAIVFFRRPASVLSADDLPTLERPASVTSGTLSAGMSRARS